MPQGKMGDVMSEDRLTAVVKDLLQAIGEDAERDGLLRTPARVAESMRFLTKGYAEDPAAMLNSALFDITYDEMVVVRDIEFYSLCEHHLLPFFGRVHIGYLPSQKVVGLSKLPRLVDVFARRLQIQERLTTEIAETFEEVLRPRGVGVVIEACHLCKMMRGVQQQNSTTITSSMRGAFERNPKTRAEFMELINQRRQSFA
jgi:GTP cyclohydrolase IA